MTLVTIAASYGAGGSRVAPALAERLGVPFLGRPPAPDVVGPGEEERACDESGGSGPGTCCRASPRSPSPGARRPA